MAYAVRAERLRRGWTQDELAAKARIGQSQISVIEADPGKTRASTLLGVAEAFNCDPAALYSGRIEGRGAPGRTTISGKAHRLEMLLTAGNLEKWLAYGEGLLASQPDGEPPELASVRRKSRSQQPRK